MEIIETLNNKIDKLIHDYDKLRLENQGIDSTIRNMKNDNDELVRNKSRICFKNRQLHT